MNKIDLGAVSAYALAKEKGYQGTEEEFATLMMQSGDNALRAEAAANRAEEILNSIPYEYTELNDQVGENTENVAALTKEVAYGKAAYDVLFGELRYDWKTIATESYPLGWANGYYDTDTAELKQSGYFMCTANKILIPDDVKKIRVKPPSGMALAVHAFRDDGTFDVFGQGNSQSHPENIDVVVSVDATRYSSVAVSVGRFATSSSGWGKDEAIVNDTVMTLIYATQQACKPEENPESIAPYFEEEAAITVESVRDLLTEPCLVFPLITDIHYMASAEKPHLFDDSIKNMERVIGNIACDFVLNLGDNTDGDTEQAVTMDRAHYMMDRFRSLGLPYYFAIGNHDTNYYFNGADGVFTLPQMYRAYISGTKDAVYHKTNLGTDCYKDFDSLGIRLVVIDANHDTRYKFSPDTAMWLSETALKTDYIVILAVHLSSIETQNWNAGSPNNRGLITDALQAFVDAGGTLIQLCGHSHADYTFSSPWLTVFSTCGKFESADTTEEGFTKITGYDGAIVSPERVVGTATEDSWSVVIVRPQARKINFVRFGAGEDREFSF